MATDPRTPEVLAELVDSAPDGLVVVDGEGCIVLVNRQAELLFGYSSEELLGQAVEVLVPDQHRGHHVADRLRFGAAPRTRVMGAGLELHGRRRDGSEFPVEISLSPIATADGLLVSSAIRDVTDRLRTKKVEALNVELERRVAARTAELEAAVQELDAFAYSISHDLRAPLRALDGFSQILAEEHSPGLGEDGRHCVGRIMDAARDMGQLVDDLLALSRLGRQTPSKARVDMASLVSEVLQDLDPQGTGRTVDIHVEALPDVYADPALLRQVWTNLLSNALKYTRDADHAQVRVGFRDGAYHVQDNGVGFDMKHADKLFGVFQRLHRTEDYEGTGVGLAIAHRIITRHGGTIWADATPGEGATFFFTLEAP